MLYAFADPKICNFDLSFAIDQNVLGLNVSVDRLSDVMDIVQSSQNLYPIIFTFSIIVAISASERDNFPA